MTDLKRKILNDIRVELTDEFDRNFQRKAFFDRKWPARKHHYPKGSLLAVTGNLRRSITSHTTADSVVWQTALPYAALHNYGGTITVTGKMKRFFWYKHRATRNDAWKHMALMRVGSKINIPQRQFLGDHPKVRKAVERVVAQNLERAANDAFKRLKH